jgi:TRAP-type C4-dicarboxylate transport system permease large subunit
MVVYRTLSFKELRKVLVEATVLTGEVMLVVGFSVALGWALSEARVPVALADLLQTIFPFESTIPQIMLMLLLALVAGMILDPLIPMIMPVLLPSLLALDIDLVHFGILMVVTVVIGQVTPPVALALIVAARIGKVDVIDTFKANTPFLISMFLFLMLLIFVPSIVTWLPNLVM